MPVLHTECSSVVGQQKEIRHSAGEQKQIEEVPGFIGRFAGSFGHKGLSKRVGNLLYM